MPLEEICQYVRTAEDSQDTQAKVLEMLHVGPKTSRREPIARLLGGNWVIRSDKLYPDDYSSPSTGVTSPALIRGRDQIVGFVLRVRG